MNVFFRVFKPYVKKLSAALNSNTFKLLHESCTSDNRLISKTELDILICMRCVNWRTEEKQTM